MEDYKRGSHTVWACKYHLVWTTQYRYDVLGGDVGRRCRELLRKIARSQEMIIYAGSINRDHVYMLIGIPPHISVYRAVQYLQGKSSHKLLSEFEQLRKRHWGQHLWGRATGFPRAAMLQTKSGNGISRNKSPQSRTMISMWPNRPYGRSVRLSVVIEATAY
jgi:putative transposase